MEIIRLVLKMFLTGVLEFRKVFQAMLLMASSQGLGGASLRNR
jgi:hypothetical protein